MPGARPRRGVVCEPEGVTSRMGRPPVKRVVLVSELRGAVILPKVMEVYKKKKGKGKGNRGSEEICRWPAACRGSIRPVAELVDRLLIEILSNRVVSIFIRLA